MNTVLQLPSIPHTSALGSFLMNLTEDKILKLLAYGMKEGVQEKTVPVDPRDYQRIREQFDLLASRGLLTEKDVAWLK